MLEEIAQSAALVKEGSGNRVLLVLAHASAGDVKQTIAALERLKPQPYLLRSCYQDADLGPILRGEPFRPFREKFPEPKDTQERGETDADEPAK